MTDIERQNMLDSFLTGKMSEEEQRRFREELSGDSSMSEDLSELKVLVGGLADVAEKKNAVAGWEKALRKKKRLRLLYPLSAVAACVAIFVVTLPSVHRNDRGPAFRGGMPASDSVAMLISGGRYKEALECIGEARCHLDIDTSLTDEAKAYQTLVAGDELRRLDSLEIVALRKSGDREAARQKSDEFERKYLHQTE